MAKLALCMRAVNAHPAIQAVRDVKARAVFTDQAVIESVLTQTEISMQDRAECETDPSYLQFIPYILVTKGDKVFTYYRGGKGEEARLHSKMSFGLGGHVDTTPWEPAQLESHLRAEAARELLEEVGIEIKTDDLDILGILVDATTPVDEVHIGILCRYEIPEQQLTLEEGVIEKGVFLNLVEASAGYLQMENWTKLSLSVLS